MPFHIEPKIIIDSTLYTLLLFSLVTWTLILFKFWQFSKSNYYNKKYASSFWRARNFNDAEQSLADQTRGPKARVAACGFRWLMEMRHPESSACLKFLGRPENLLEQALRKQSQDERKRLESGLTMLASIGSTAPFVGLFGTVLGIMHAMHDISASGSASLDVVAGPIGDALIATAIGIAVAVPAVLAYNFFLRSAKNHQAALDNFVDGFLHIAFSNNGVKE